MNTSSELGLETIPSIAVLFLNLIVMYYVFRERKTEYRIFLLLNALAMTGYTICTWYSLNFQAYESPWLRVYRSGTAFFSLLMLANLIGFALEFPTPLSRPFTRSAVRIAIVLASGIAALGLYKPEFEILRRTDFVIFSSWAQIWRLEGPFPLMLGVLYFIVLSILLSVQYATSTVKYQKNLARHLIYIVACPLIFIVLFSLFSTSIGYPLVPSLFFTTAVISQFSTLVVVRQVETKRPLYLSRWIYFSITVLVGFVLASLLYNLYESLTNEVLLTAQVRNTILITILLFVLVGSFPQVQAIFDRIMFSRAYEYRQLVLEAQEELNATRERLRQAERLSVVGEMAAQIAHEIKNPLGPIKGYTQMMRMHLLSSTDFPNRTQFLDHLEVIVEEVENIDRKIHQLLDFSKRQEMHMEVQDLNRVVERAAVLLRIEAESLEVENRETGRILVQEELDPKLPQVEFNRNRLEEVLSNIGRNALEARKDTGLLISISTRACKDENGVEGVEICLEDNGIGISKGALNNLFQPFYTEKKSGTGLGLSIVRSHIQVHQGKIVFNLRESGGTTVNIWLPLRQSLKAPTKLP
ncbi:MAG: ATP-binding protein [Candidatus Sumerlaeia bacterium]|nr:ATP-binding protein [Candidatus Sumerlaeia bacterium]